MRKDIFIMLGICFTLLFGYNATSEHEIIDINHTQVVTVKTGDTLWTIAERTATENLDVRHVIYAMKDLNNLESGAALKPGTKLIVPTIKKVNPVQVMDYKMAQN